MPITTVPADVLQCISGLRARGALCTLDHREYNAALALAAKATLKRKDVYVSTHSLKHGRVTDLRRTYAYSVSSTANLVRLRSEKTVLIYCE